jgi:hypothetical protein
VSIGTAQGEPMVSEDTFDRDWAAARGGTLEGPAGQPVSGDGTPEPSAPATPDAGQFGTASPAPASPPVAAQAPSEPVQQPFALPDQYQQRLREVGAASLDDALTMARQFQSVRGQLPNLEQRWREQHVAPLEQELTTLREERRQALDRLVQVDPNTGQQRPPQDQAYIRQQIAAAEAQQTEAQRRQQEQNELQQMRATVQQQQAQAQQSETEALKLTALNVFPQWKAEIARVHGIPVAELDTYTQQFGYDDRIKNFRSQDDLRQVGPMMESLQQYAIMRQGQLTQQQAAQANTAGRYRDVGAAGSGTGGQAAGDRWVKANDQDFESAWKRALRGELV